MMVHITGGHSACSTEQKYGETKGHNSGFRLDEWYFPSVAYADDIVMLRTSQEARKQMILDLIEGFREIGLE